MHSSKCRMHVQGQSDNLILKIQEMEAKSAGRVRNANGMRKFLERVRAIYVST